MWPAPAHIDELRARNELQELARALIAEQVDHAAGTGAVGIVNVRARRCRPAPATRVERVSSGEPNRPLTIADPGPQSSARRRAGGGSSSKTVELFGGAGAEMFVPARFASATASSDSKPSSLPFHEVSRMRGQAGAAP